MQEIKKVCTGRTLLKLNTVGLYCFSQVEDNTGMVTT